MLLMKKEKPENSRNKLFDGHAYFSSTDATRLTSLIASEWNWRRCRVNAFRVDMLV